MKRLFIIFGFFLLLFTPIACKSSSPKAAIRICDNLVGAEFIESADCTTSQIYSEFIPHYFHVNEATFDYVSIGMQGFEKISFYENNEGCSEGQHYIYADYLTGTTESVGLSFCDNVLVNISYHESIIFTP